MPSLLWLRQCRYNEGDCAQFCRELLRGYVAIRGALALWSGWGGGGCRAACGATKDGRSRYYVERV
jgi:hypothetical protein